MEEVWLNIAKFISIFLMVIGVVLYFYIWWVLFRYLFFILILIAVVLLFSKME